MGKRSFSAIIVLLLIAIVTAYGYKNYKDTATYTDKYGFVHNSDHKSVGLTEDENSMRNYALVSLDKEKLMDMNEHEFINVIDPILKNYSDKKYTTIAFDDGTGLFFPFSKIIYAATYGYIDEEGNITESLGTVSVTGTQVTYSEVNGSISKKSAEIYDYIPDDYINDDLAACVDDEGIFISVSKTARDDEEAEIVVEELVKSLRTYITKDTKAMNVVLNHAYGYEINPRTYSLKRNDDIISKTLNKVGLY